MKFSIKAQKRHGTAHAKSAPAPAGWWPPPRWVVLGVCLLLGCGGTLAFCELVVWNTLPAALVGKWEVIAGPEAYKDATFEFFRNGAMEMGANRDGYLVLIEARVKVEGDKIYSTTRHSKTREQHTDILYIKTLSATQLVVADEQGGMMEMIRAG